MAGTDGLFDLLVIWMFGSCRTADKSSLTGCLALFIVPGDNEISIQLDNRKPFRKPLSDGLVRLEAIVGVASQAYIGVVSLDATQKENFQEL